MAGGKREGAGRPKKAPTTTVSFRINTDNLSKAKSVYGRDLNRIMNEFIRRLAKVADKKEGAL